MAVVNPSTQDPLDVRHDTFTVQRDLDAPASAVFAAFADAPIRRRWFRLPGSGDVYEHDFRVGGGELAEGTFRTPDAAPERLAYRSRYLDIVPDRRLVFTYESVVDDVLRWVSLTTILLRTLDDRRSALSWTEQVAFVSRTGDGSADLAHLRGATSLRLNGLEAALEATT